MSELISTVEDMFGTAIEIYAIVMGFIAIIQCFFGYKLIRWWVCICGALVGGGIGAIFGAISGNEGLLLLGVIVGGGFGGWISFKIYMFTLFMLGLVSGFGIGVALGIFFGLPEGALVFGFVLGILAAIGVVILTKPIMILITAIPAGIQLGILSGMIFENEIVGGVFAIVMSGVGIWYQFRGDKLHKQSQDEIKVESEMVSDQNEKITKNTASDKLSVVSKKLGESLQKGYDTVEKVTKKGEREESPKVPIVIDEYEPQKKLELIYKKVQLKIMGQEEWKVAQNDFLKSVEKDGYRELKKIKFEELNILPTEWIEKIEKIKETKQLYHEMALGALCRCYMGEKELLKREWIEKEIRDKYPQNMGYQLKDYPTLQELIKDKDKWNREMFEVLMEFNLIK